MMMETTSNGCLWKNSETYRHKNNLIGTICLIIKMSKPLEYYFKDGSYVT